MLGIDLFGSGANGRLLRGRLQALIATFKLSLKARQYGIFAAIGFLALGGNAHADWVLNNEQSQLNFISIKATHVAEVHHFKSLAGSIDDSGDGQVSIDLTSVATGIDIRNQRMQSMLFMSDQMPQATIDYAIKLAPFLDMATGDTADITLDAQLSLVGMTQQIAAPLQVLKLSDAKVQVATTSPLIINVASAGLTQGVDALREIAGLPSISYAVPVTFRLTFEQE